MLPPKPPKPPKAEKPPKPAKPPPTPKAETPPPEPAAASPPSAVQPPGAAVDLLNRAVAQLVAEDGWADFKGVGTLIRAIAPNFAPKSYGCSKLSLLCTRTGQFEVRRGKHGQILVRSLPFWFNPPDEVDELPDNPGDAYWASRRNCRFEWPSPALSLTGNLVLQRGQQKPQILRLRDSLPRINSGRIGPDQPPQIGRLAHCRTARENADGPVARRPADGADRPPERAGSRYTGDR